MRRTRGKKWLWLSGGFLVVVAVGVSLMVLLDKPERSELADSISLLTGRKPTREAKYTELGTGFGGPSIKTVEKYRLRIPVEEALKQADGPLRRLPNLYTSGVVGRSRYYAFWDFKAKVMHTIKVMDYEDHDTMFEIWQQRPASWAEKTSAWIRTALSGGRRKAVVVSAKR